MNKVTTEPNGNVALVRVEGEVDLSWSEDLRRNILDALTGHVAVGVELSQVSYIDSSGIAALVEGYQVSRGDETVFGLVAASEAVTSVLQLARLDQVLPMHDSIDALTNAA